MFPSDIEMYRFDGHPLVQFRHDGSLVMVGSSEDMREEENQGECSLVSETF